MRRKVKINIIKYRKYLKFVFLFSEPTRYAKWAEFWVEVYAIQHCTVNLHRLTEKEIQLATKRKMPPVSNQKNTTNNTGPAISSAGPNIDLPVKLDVATNTEHSGEIFKVPTKSDAATITDVSIENANSITKFDVSTNTDHLATNTEHSDEIVELPMKSDAATITDFSIENVDLPMKFDAATNTKLMHTKVNAITITEAPTKMNAETNNNNNETDCENSAEFANFVFKSLRALQMKEQKCSNLLSEAMQKLVKKPAIAPLNAKNGSH